MNLINQPLTAAGKQPMDAAELLGRYAAGERDFKNVSLSGAELSGAQGKRTRFLTKDSCITRSILK